MKSPKYISIILALAISVLYIIFADYYSFPWCDEIYFSGPSYSIIKGGVWYHDGLGNPYPPLYSLILAGWYSLFGVSHMSSVSLEVLFALIAYVFLTHILDSRKFFSHRSSFYLMLLLYWFGFYMPTIITMARTDMLVLLLVLVIINEIVPYNGVMEIHKGRVLFASFLLAMSAIYPLPFVVIVFVFLYITSNKLIRNNIAYIGIYILCGFCIGVIATCLFAFYNNYILNFVSWILGAGVVRISITERLLNAYHDIPTLILFLISFIICKLNKSSKIPLRIYIFVLLIPALMTIAGRYERYYWWMMYIPVIIIFIINVESLSRKFVNYSLIISLLLCLFSQTILFQYPDRYTNDYFNMNWNKNLFQYYDEKQKTDRIVLNNRNLLNQKIPAVFVSELFYYTLLTNDYSCWYLYNSKYPSKGISHDRSKWYWRFYEDNIRQGNIKSFPNKGYFFSMENLHTNECIDYLKSEGYTYKVYKSKKSPTNNILLFEKK